MTNEVENQNGNCRMIKTSDELLSVAIQRIHMIHEMSEKHGQIIDSIPSLHTMVSSLVSQFSMLVGALDGMRAAADKQAEASRSMAETFKLSETRQVNLEHENEKARDQTIDIAQNKNSVPMDVHKSIVKWVAVISSAPLLVILTCTILYFLYATKIDISANMGSNKIDIKGNGQAQNKQEENKGQ